MRVVLRRLVPLLFRRKIGPENDELGLGGAQHPKTKANAYHWLYADDSFYVAASSHPLRSLTDLALLRPHFSPQGSVEVVPGPVGLPQTVSGVPTVAGQGGIGGLQGAGKMISSLTNNPTSHAQLAATLGVPVRPGRS